MRILLERYSDVFRLAEVRRAGADG